MKDEPKWKETKHNKDGRYNPFDVGADPFVEGSTSVDQQGKDTPSDKRPLGRDATKASRKKSATTSSSSVGTDFAANLQELSIGKMNQWREEIDRRSSRDEQLIAIERLKHEDKVRLDREKLELERERIELLRRAEEREREKAERQRRAEEERIMAIDLDSLTNARLRAYYKSCMTTSWRECDFGPCLMLALLYLYIAFYETCYVCLWFFHYETCNVRIMRLVMYWAAIDPSPCCLRRCEGI
jgi:hypothetical protein